MFNASTDGSAEMVAEKFPKVKLMLNRENVGFARGNNQAAELAMGEYLLLLNSDACLLPGTLETLLTFAVKTEQAVVIGSRLVNPDGSFQFSYADFPNLWREFLTLSTLGRRIFRRNYPSHRAEVECGPQIVDYVNGACLLIRSDIYRKSGGLPDQYFMYAEEVDFCLTVKQAGGQVWYHPAAQVMHHGSASSQNRLAAREGDMYQSRVRFMRKYRGNLAASMLKAEMVVITASKVFWHNLIRRLSHGKYGRPVISLQQLIARLQEV
jgi:N-acetylglucosaminyl-diphospho-decaprenol L-rhamnosyltransferase